MSWFTDIKENTLIKVVLENNKEIEIYFIKVSDGIVEGKLTNGKTKKFKENQIEDLEELSLEDDSQSDILVSKSSKQIINNILEKKQKTKINEVVSKIPSIKTFFTNKIDNSILSPIEFKGKDSLLELKSEDKNLYSTVMNIVNQFNNAKKIKELDSKFGRSPQIFRKLNDLLEEAYNKEIDNFLAYVLQESDVSYFESFRKMSTFIYCLKHDIYFFNIKNNKYGFVVAEQLFELYDLDSDIENEWMYLIKNMPTFNSFKTLQYQYDFGTELSENYQNLLDESINYISVKLKIKETPNLMIEQIKFFKDNFNVTHEYESLDSINRKVEKSISSKENISIDLSYNSFSSMGDSFYKVMQPNIEKELEKELQPNGIIKTFFKDRNYGFIENIKGITHHFTIQNIIDKSLLRELQERNNPNRYLEVCFSTSYNYKGEVADAIQKPKQINKILNDVIKYKNDGHYNIAEKILKQILSQYSNNLKVKKVYSDLMNSKPKLSKNYSNSNKYENYGGYGNYKKANNAKFKKDYNTAIKYYELALKNNEKIESTIKDLALAYYENIEDSEHVEKSRKFLLDNEDKLSRTITTYNFLENHYFSVGEYNKSIEYINIILKTTHNKNREIILLGKKATCYVKLNNKVDAKEILEEILRLQRDNSYAKRLLEVIETGNLDIEIDISFFGGGLSKFIEKTLTDYAEYAGIPPKVVESQDFQYGTLKEIRRIIKEAGKARPKERANYLLTEAKLMQVLEPDKDNNQRSVLARYCNAMALNHVSENSAKEVIRFYYLEAFNLEEDYRSLANHVSFYLFTYIRNYSELLNTKDTSLDDVFRELLFSNNKLFWDGVVDMFIWNETIAKHLIKKLFDNKTFRKKASDFLELNEVKLFNTNLENFTKNWDEIRERRKRDYDNWFVKVRSLLKIEQIEVINNQMNGILDEIDREWLYTTDKHRLNTLKEINIMLNDYLKEKTFDDKERTKNYLITKINELIDEIDRFPTKFSYEGYKGVLEHIEKIIKASFNDVLTSSKPIVSVKLLGESVAVNNKSVSLQLSIQLNKDSSPISNTKVSVINTENITFKNGETEIYESIRGTEERILKVDIEVSDKVIENLVTDMKMKLTYNTRISDEVENKEYSIPIRLYSSEKFEKIQNVYAPLAEGGAVTDKSMFFGRDEYIDNIVNSLVTSNSKSIIVYGQKRSGKTSVLHHLKKSLENKENAFCISFSMGEIVEDLSSVTLYDKILEEIDEELENLEDDGYEVPSFTKPNIAELEKYPASIFNESLKNFNKSLKNLDDWKDKKLVILIDEFTYVYTSIEKNELNSNFMKSWKAFIEKKYFSAVLIGQDVAPKFKQKYPNEFGVTEDKRLTYLSEKDARELIEKPIWDKERDSSRYIGNAVDKVIGYTSCSPYYLQMFCARVVDYINRNKAISVTESDIEEISNTFIEGAESLSVDKFDNLFTAGDADIESFNIDDVEDVLIQIAKKSNIGSCARDDIRIENQEKNIVDNILDDLIVREVIEQRNSFYKIKVGLFKKWLLKQ